jgi:hypothetical protein
MEMILFISILLLFIFFFGGTSMDYVTRKEKILCLSHNTVRIVDYPIQKELDSVLGIQQTEEERMMKVISRNIKDLSTVNGIDKETTNKFIHGIYSKAYADAPRGKIYDVLYTLKYQKFVSGIYLMHLDKRITEEEWTDCYYSGKIEEVERFINENGITMFILDDITDLYRIIEREQINVTGMTFLVSKLGYNYYTVGDSILLKHEPEIVLLSESKGFEFGIMSVWDF